MIDRDAPAPAKITAVRTRLPAGVLASGHERLTLSWQVEAADPDATQVEWVIERSSTPDLDSGASSSASGQTADQVDVVAPGPALRSRETAWLRVRVRTQAGWTSWSPTVAVEAGLLDASDWTADAVTLPDDPGAQHQAASPILRREFNVPGVVARARLHVTSLGLNVVTINGRPVTTDLLAPGWTPYGHRLLADTYDVAELIRQGPNAIGAMLGDGWFRGRLGWNPDGDRGKYGDQIALLAQLEVELADGSRMTVQTDPTWRASTAEVVAADLYDGAHVDLRRRQDRWDEPGFDDHDWLPVAVVPIDRSTIEPRTAPPVRSVASLPVVRTDRGGGRILLDGGQNIAGFVRLRVRGARGAQVRVRHAEVLEPDGSLHVRSLRSAKATDEYVLANDSPAELAPLFTFHGFRYAEVETDAELLDAEFVAISSDTPPRGTFESSNPLLNRFHENVLWSLRDNFVAVPTDCPQRDERLGWTGDAQAFAATGSILVDAQAFWRSWLRDLAFEQDPKLGVPSVVPNVVLDGPMEYGRAGWADAATIVPWAVHDAYGDRAVLADQWASMRAWVDSLAARRGPDGLLEPGPQFGDWLDPDAPPDRPWLAKADGDFLANAFFTRSARLTSDAAEALGMEAEARTYGRLADEMAALTWGRWSEHARGTQTGCAVALCHGIVPEPERAGVAAALALQVREADGRIATGFLGTPLVLPALAATDHFDEAYLMLLRQSAPSWLYQVVQGATTVWERWDAIRPDGSIHPGTMQAIEGESEPDGHMLSFNHYAYGAVVEWVYRHVAGIAPDLPGYRRIRFAPRPHASLSRARASIETPYGRAAIAWQIDGAGSLVSEVSLPFGTTGIFSGALTDRSQVTTDGRESTGEVELGPSHHVILITEPRLAGATPASPTR